ncbi:FGGY-family carbohydrate kinase [Marinobacterium sedimentorum]|uniref:FGGY-family carbohydrate kinase n=1 Tax=Marinobacterium sedimentorum TaxID=2927804 RepID=UPI0020C6CBF6|nr:FGGY family carbohydrate kinase [Marinobacterium sedimentorum]MCP8688839.1 FGGY family carbohydrate kinase [Marinobacterium sedimentorum]
MQAIIVVLDIGKTNVKLCALDAMTGTLLESLRRSNDVIMAEPYPQADIEGIWRWYCDGIVQLGRRYAVRFLTFTTHGATAVCLAGHSPALPVLDYESDLCEQTSADYDPVRPDYEETLSPALGCGLNLGRQLFWLAHTRPDDFARVDTILMYPQYWGWRLSGVAASEVTSLGCHTDLWQPQRQRYSSLVERLDWQGLFPPLLRAGEVLGPVLPELARELGLPADCQVINGIHDSNASLVPYLRHLEVPFTVISTGTWTVMAGIGAPLQGLREQDDMLANVSAFGDPVPCIRFMGGREWELLRDADDCDLADLQRVLEQGVFALPSFSSQGGPFRDRQGAVIGPADSLNARERTALAALYCAQVTDYCLSRLQSAGDIFVEGSFARNAVYLSVLQSLRPYQQVRASEDSTGTTQGAAQVIPGCDWAGAALAAPVERPEMPGLADYCHRWRELVNGQGR